MKPNLLGIPLSSRYTTSKMIKFQEHFTLFNVVELNLRTKWGQLNKNQDLHSDFVTRRQVKLSDSIFLQFNFCEVFVDNIWNDSPS